MIPDAGRCLPDRKSWLAFAVGIFVGIVLTNIQVASVNGGADCARMASNLPVWRVPFESNLIPDNVPAMTSESLSVSDLLHAVRFRHQLPVSPARIFDKSGGIWIIVNTCCLQEINISFFVVAAALASI